MNQACIQEEVAELFMVKLADNTLTEFISHGNGVHTYFSSFNGYAGLEIGVLSETQVMILLRWKSYTLFDQSLPSILNACPITNWLNGAHAVTHQPLLMTQFLNNTDTQKL